MVKYTYKKKEKPKPVPAPRKPKVKPTPKPRPKSTMTEKSKPVGSHKMPDGTVMSGKTHSKDSKPVKKPPAGDRVKFKFKNKPNIGDNIKITGGVRGGIDDSYLKDKLVIDDVLEDRVDIDFKNDKQGDFIGSVKIKFLKKTKTGWSVPASKVGNRATNFWSGSG